MKSKNRLKRLEARRSDFDRSPGITKANETSVSNTGRRVFHRPGSMSK